MSTAQIAPEYPLSPSPPPRLSPYRLACLVLVVIGFTLIALTIHHAWQRGGTIIPGLPYGPDFTSFYAASKLMLSGTPELVYSKAAHHAAQLALTEPDTGYYAYFYPPIFMLYCLPLALLDYMPSVLLWIGVTFAFYMITMRVYARQVVDVLPILAFSGTQFNLLAGQNAFLTTGLMGSGLILLEKRPYLAGLCFGLLAYKPHLGIIIPFFLLAAGQWRAILSASITVIALILLSIGLFGVETWHAFLLNASSAVNTLETGSVGNDKMHSLFGALRMMGVSLTVAYAGQTLLTLAVLAVVMVLARRSRERLSDMTPLVACGATLVTPFVLAYDLALLAIPLIYLLKENASSPLSGFEKAVMLLAFVTPAAANFATMDYGIPYVPCVIFSLFGLIARRVWLKNIAHTREAEAVFPIQAFTSR